METKTYFASSVPAALDLARKELGNDAMLLGSRPAPAEARSFGRLEVTFAYEPSAVLVAPSSRRIADTPTASRNGSDLVDIREELAALRSAIRSAPGTGIALDPDRRVINRLVRHGVEENTAREIAEAAARRPESPDLAVRNELQQRIRVRPFAEWKQGESRTLAFIGPPGRGKSSSLVKIAIRHGLAAKVPTRIYSAGVHQVGAAEQMARYAAILGVPFNWFETVEALHLALNGDKWRGLSLVDTPGISPGDQEEIAGWERIFRAHPDMERHLVLRADSRSADVCHMITRLGCLNPSHLLFTGLDEVGDYASLVEGAIRSKLPLGFAGSGPRIPEDLTTVDGNALIRRIWAEQSMAAAA